MSKVKKKSDKKRFSKKKEKKNKRKSKRTDFDIIQKDSKAKVKEKKLNKRVKLGQNSISSNAFNLSQEVDELFETQLDINSLDRPDSIKG